jgi:hypothetical protein
VVNIRKIRDITCFRFFNLNLIVTTNNSMSNSRSAITLMCHLKKLRGLSPQFIRFKCSGIVYDAFYRYL